MIEFVNEHLYKIDGKEVTCSEDCSFDPDVLEYIFEEPVIVEGK